MVDYAAMGGRIKTRRRARHLSQKDVADAVQISMSYYGNIERGRRVPSLETLVAIANVLEVGVDYLLADSLNAAEAQRSPEEKQVLARYFREQMAELDYGDVPPEAH